MKKLGRILLIIVFIAGLGVFLFPLASNFYTNNVQTHVVQNYNNEVEKSTKEELEAVRNEMKKRNKTLREGAVVADPFAEGGAEGDAGKDAQPQDAIDAMEEKTGGVIAVLTIPAIKLETPVYDGVTEYQLQKGIGVLPGTSMPVGGKDTHSVITGHRGLPTAKLFTDLPDVKEGDMFYLDVAGEKLAYKVEKIKVIEPHEIGDLKILPGEDVVTLLTCTPYMINTHRLIVTGYRTYYKDAVKEVTRAASSDCCEWTIILLLILLALVVLLMLMLLFMFRKLGKMQQQMAECKKEIQNCCKCSCKEGSPGGEGAAAAGGVLIGAAAAGKSKEEYGGEVDPRDFD